MGKKLLSKLKIENVKRGTARRILALFSAITVFVTTYSLILPALTIDDETAEKEPGFDVVQTEENGTFVLRDSLQQEAAEKISRFSICSDLSVGAVLTDGSFDEGVKMGVEAVDNEDIINAAVDATDRFDREPVKVRAVKISFKDENDEEYLPEAPLDLTLSGKGITDATNPVIVRVDKDGKAEEVEPKDFGELLYLKDESSPVYAVVETKEITRRTLTAEGSDYKISVEYGEDANIPNSAELRATELKQGSTVYSSFLNQAKEEIPDDRIVSDARFFDVSILNDGEEIEPESEVSVKITYNDSLELKNDSEVLAVHFTDKGTDINEDVTTKDTKDGGSEVSFKQDSFSTCGTLITDASMLEVGKSYILVAEKNGKYYAVSNTITGNYSWNRQSTCPQYEVSLDINGTTVAIHNMNKLRNNNILWKYSVSNNSAVLQNVDNNRYMALNANNTMTTTGSTALTLENADNGRIRVRRGTSNYYLYLPSNNTNFQISNSNSTPLYFIEYDTSKGLEYQIRFHYVDGDGNEISPTVERFMEYSQTAVDLRDSTYAIDVSGYEYMESRYGVFQGDRVRYVQNETTGSGSNQAIIINLKNDAMYQADQGNTPLSTTVYYGNSSGTVYTNITDRISLSNRPDHKIDIYMVYNEEGAPDPNEIIKQKDSSDEFPEEEFPLGAPDHTKKLVPNYTDGAWDGTYTLYLDVTGKAASLEEGTKADIILVYDTSNSMHDNAHDNRKRYEIAHDLVMDMAETLFAYNTPGETDPTVRVGVVSYATTAKREFGYVDNLDDFNTGFAFADQASTYDKGASGGTNWEDGLQTARALYDEQHRPNAKQYIIFVSDGEPTCRVTRGDYYQNRDIGEYNMSNNNQTASALTDSATNKQYYTRGSSEYNLNSNRPDLYPYRYYYTGVEHCYSNAKDDARSFVDAGANLYTVGIFSTEEKIKQMNTLANYAYS
ncbi:MAG: vWA domain-containing protein, partial [Ruminococcus sp.]|nr:vWA domain-containing protein [Ruminococcus sp.]